MCVCEGVCVVGVRECVGESVCGCEVGLDVRQLELEGDTIQQHDSKKFPAQTALQ